MFQLFLFQEAPYLIDSGQGFVGYIPELLRAIKVVMENELGLPFDYEIELVSEGQYGRLDATTGRWSGLMEKLVEGVSDSNTEILYDLHEGFCFAVANEA